jgi:LPS export ABC transporter protein LptC
LKTLTNKNKSISLKSILAISFAGMLFFGCGKNDLNEVNQIGSTQLEPIQVSYGVIIEFNNNGLLSFKLAADKMMRYASADSSYIEFFGNIFLEGFNSEGEKETQMTADYGLYLQTSYKMIAKENVELINVKNEILNTEELTWNQQTRRVYTNKAVSIVQEDGIIHGIGLDADEGFMDYTIREITGSFDIEEQARDTLNFIE